MRNWSVFVNLAKFNGCLHIPLCRLMQSTVLRLKQIFSRSIYGCDSVDSSTDFISFPDILIVSLHNSLVSNHAFIFYLICRTYPSMKMKNFCMNHCIYLEDFFLLKRIYLRKQPRPKLI